jgi:replicative DNA helicase
MLSNSKTGKAGAADFILMVGASDDPLLRNSRWLSLPKNKLARSGGPKDPRVEVTFDGARSRFNNPERLQ